MTDPLTVSASIIAVVTLAYSSSKTLFETVKGIRDAPKTFQDLCTDLAALQEVLGLLGARLDSGGQGGAFSEAQVSCLEHLAAPLSACSDVCSEFKLRLERLTCRSSDQHTSFRDRLKLQFKDKEITAFRYRLASYKLTLSIALEFASLKQNSQGNQAINDVIEKFEGKIEGAMNRLSGQMQGIEISQQAAIEAGAPQTEFANIMEQQNIALAACLKSCTAALSSTAQSTGNTFKYVRAFDDARQLIGTIGDVRGGGFADIFDVLIAQDRSRQMAGRIDGRLALDFMNAPLVKIGGNESASSKLPMPEMPS